MKAEKAYNIVKELALSPSETKRLILMLQGHKRLKPKDLEIERFKENFKQKLKQASLKNQNES